MANLPIKAYVKDEVADEVYTETSVTLHGSGRLDAVTHTWTDNKFIGAHAVAGVVLVDGDNHQLWYSGAHMCGISGEWEPGGRDDRRCDWSEKIPPEVLNQVADCKIVHGNTGEIEFLEILKKKFL